MSKKEFLKNLFKSKKECGCGVVVVEDHQEDQTETEEKKDSK